MNPHPAVSLHSLRESWLCAGVEVLDTLVHELIHASDDCELRRGASAGLELQGRLQAIVILPLFSVLLKPPIMRTSCFAAGPLSSVAQTSSG